MNLEYIIWGDRTYSKKAVFDVQVRDNIYHNIYTICAHDRIRSVSSSPILVTKSKAGW